MGRMGGSKQLKRMPAPAFWSIARKNAKWTVKPTPGPHPIERSLPLLLIIRDILDLAKTRREAKLILLEGNVRIDGKIRKGEDYPVGLMDVIEIPTINKTYRLLPTPKKGLTLHIIKGEETRFKLCKIVNKVTIKGGHLQLNLHDGRNIMVKTVDPKNPAKDIHTTSDVLKLKIPEQEVLGHLKLDAGVLALVTGGKNIGRLGRVVKIAEDKESPSSAITLIDDKETQFETVIDYVFPIGRGEPWISMPEGEQ